MFGRDRWHQLDLQSRTQASPHVWIWRRHSPLAGSRVTSRFFFRDEFDPDSDAAVALKREILHSDEVVAEVRCYASYVAVEWRPNGGNPETIADRLCEATVGFLGEQFCWGNPRVAYIASNLELVTLRMREYPDGSKWMLGA